MKFDLYARWASLAVILGIAVLRATLAVLPIAIFDVDPARDPTPAIGIGPAASLTLDALLLCASGIALWAEVRAQRGLSKVVVVLAVAPACAVLWWAFQDSADAFRGMTWLAAACAFVALAHLVRDRSMRVVAVSVLVAVSAPLAVRGLEQAFIEHPNTVRQFEATRTQLFAERGWELDSSAARTYERRLRQREATGWFGLSNPYSSVLGASFVVLALAAWCGWRKRDLTGEPGESVAPGVALTVTVGALLAISLLTLNFGKGALIATLMGCAIVAWSIVSKRVLHPRVIVLAAALAFLAIIVRGTLGESFGELSLYFRSLYLEGSIRAFLESPRVGVGPDGLQSAFMRVKPSTCPEDVQSAHSVFIDWLVLLGPLGVAWAAMIALSLRGVIEDCRATAEKGMDASQAALRIAFAIVLIGLVSQALIEQPILDTFSLALRAAGWMAFVALAACAAVVFAASPLRMLAAAAIAGAVVVLAHAQIEMTFWLPGSVVWMMAMLACATTLRASDSRRVSDSHAAMLPTRIDHALVLTPLLLACVAAMFALRQRAVEHRLERAAGIVRPLYDVRQAFTELSKSIGQGSATPVQVDQLVESVRDASASLEGSGEFGSDAAMTALETALSANDLGAVRQTLVDLDVALREHAAQQLIADGSTAQPEAAWNRLLREVAVKQRAASGRRALGGRSSEFDLHAMDAAIGLTRFPDSPRAERRMLLMRCELEWEALQTSVRKGAKREDTQVQALALLPDFVQATEASPHAPMRWLMLGDLHELAGARDNALVAWRQAREVNAALHLDPLAQLPEGASADLEVKCALPPAKPLLEQAPT